MAVCPPKSWHRAFPLPTSKCAFSALLFARLRVNCLSAQPSSCFNDLACEVRGKPVPPQFRTEALLTSPLVREAGFLPSSAKVEISHLA